MQRLEFCERWISAARLVWLGLLFGLVAWTSDREMPELAGLARHLLPLSLWMLVGAAIWAAAMAVKAFPSGPRIALASLVVDVALLGYLLRAGWPITYPWALILALRASLAAAARGGRAVWLVPAAAAVIVAWAAPASVRSEPVIWLTGVFMFGALPMTLAWLVRETKGLVVDNPEHETQQRFIGMLSHELRSPLHVVINAGRLIDRSRVAPGDLALLDSIVSSGRSLLSMVDDLLDVAAIRAGRIELTPVAFRIHHVLDRVRDAIEIQAEAKQLTVTWAVDTSLPVLFASKRHIEQVLCNLATNAVKYTPPGGKIHISLHHESIPSAEGQQPDLALLFGVSDSGVGIPDQEKAGVFEPFHQVSQGAARLRSGVGLGLHIVKKISDAMGGQLAVHDNPSGGTLFTWRVTVQPAAGEAAVSPTDALSLLDHHRERATPLACLIIDDSLTNREIMRQILLRGGHIPTLREDAESGMLAIRSQPFDLIFMDLHMPGLSGWDVLEQLAVSPGLDQVAPVIILSATADKESPKLALAKGATGFLTKPVVIEQLIQVFETKPLRTHVEPNVEREAPGRATHLHLLRQVSPTAAGSFLTDTRADIEECLKVLDEAHRSDSHPVFAEQLHRLKNGCLNAGLDDLASQCQSILDALSDGASIGEHVPAVRTINERALAVIRSQPEMQASTVA